MLSYRWSGPTPGPAALHCCVVSWVFECSGLSFGTCLAQPSLKVGQFEPVVSWYNAPKSGIWVLQVGCRDMRGAAERESEDAHEQWRRSSTINRRYQK